MMTSAAEKFVTRLTMETLSEQPVYIEMFPEDKFYSTHHISLAEWADLILLCPASGNLIGKIAAGIADDLLTTVVMAAQSTVMIAPSMNTHMYENPIVQENISKLSKLGYQFIAPGVGELACKTYGAGRLAEPVEVVERVVAFFAHPADLAKLRILITAGPTVEFIDAVRYISNPSTGKMGYALAEKALLRGAQVTLISGPTVLAPPKGVELIMIRSGDQMLAATKKHFSNADILFMAAAVADYTPAQTINHKMKKTGEPINLKLEPQADILMELAALKRKEQITVGFALETEDEIVNATQKLHKKKLDMIVVNNPNVEGAGFGYDTNQVTVIFGDGRSESLPLMPKTELADKILDLTMQIVRDRK